mmetsp:Transcript_43378/g.134076  ORF Transcript_43378/g.134076 Transcript_43378/m.134076 type:complete len:254 (+) Transcript_43378:667-1428(+)
MTLISPEPRPQPSNRLSLLSARLYTADADLRRLASELMREESLRRRFGSASSLFAVLAPTSLSMRLVRRSQKHREPDGPPETMRVPSARNFAFQAVGMDAVSSPALFLSRRSQRPMPPSSEQTTTRWPLLDTSTQLEPTAPCLSFCDSASLPSATFQTLTTGRLEAVTTVSAEQATARMAAQTDCSSSSATLHAGSHWGGASSEALASSVCRRTLGIPAAMTISWRPHRRTLRPRQRRGPPKAARLQPSRLLP